MNTIPSKFESSIGGYTGRSFSVVLTENGTLEYRSSGYGFKNWRKSIITPSTEMWAAFRQSIDEIEIWKWKKHYSSKGVICDGTSWGLEIAYDDKMISTGGSNNYPVNGFKEFLEAVQLLIGGRKFA